MKSFFNYQGFAPDYSHAGSYVPDIALVIPLRHPLDVHRTLLHRGNHDLSETVHWWHDLIERAKSAFLFPIIEKDEALERAACEYVGIDWKQGFPWVPVGATSHDRERIEVPELDFAVRWFEGQ